MNTSAEHTEQGSTRLHSEPTPSQQTPGEQPPSEQPRTGMTGFCVLGVESTALVPGEPHRIVELAIMQVDAHGETLNSWHTLVNPQRPLGPLGSHGLTDDDLRDAPNFAEIAGRVGDRLAGRVVVAHNARFVLDLLSDELERAGTPAPTALEPVCTMQLARDLLPGAGRSLADCGAAYGLDSASPPAGDCAPGALRTATATTALLRAYLLSAGPDDGWAEAIDRAAHLLWPVVNSRGGVPPTRPRPASLPPRHSLDGLPPSSRFSDRAPLRLPDFTGPDEQLDYLALLDRCLVDGTLLTHAPAHPLSALSVYAGRAHIDARTRTRLHHGYAEQLLRVALADGALTARDRADLFAVTRMLGGDPERPLPDSGAAVAPIPAGTVAPVCLARGDTIVLTESLMRGTAVWAREIAARGFTVAAAVTLRTRLVVAADPTALSGMIAKARDYGIPIVSEFALRSVMGID